MQDALECRAAIRHVPARHEGVGDVRPPHCRSRRGLGEHVVPAELGVVLDDPRHHRLGTVQTLFADLRRRGDQGRVRRIHEVPEHMHAGVLQLRAQLESGQHGDPGSAGGVECLAPPRGGIVVGDRDHV